MPDWLIYFFAALMAFFVAQGAQYIQIKYGVTSEKRLRMVTGKTQPWLIEAIKKAVEEGELRLSLDEETAQLLIEAVGERVKNVWKGIIGNMQAQANNELEGQYEEYNGMVQAEMGQEQIGQMIMNKVMQGFMKKLEKM